MHPPNAPKDGTEGTNEEHESNMQNTVLSQKACLMAHSQANQTLLIQSSRSSLRSKPPAERLISPECSGSFSWQSEQSCNFPLTVYVESAQFCSYLLTCLRIPHC